jgi:hypothetical protein
LDEGYATIPKRLRVERVLHARIDAAESVGCEYLVGRLLPPGDELIEKVVGRDASVKDLLFRGDILHS